MFFPLRLKATALRIHFLDDYRMTSFACFEILLPIYISSKLMRGVENQLEKFSVYSMGVQTRSLLGGGLL